MIPKKKESVAWEYVADTTLADTYTHVPLNAQHKTLVKKGVRSSCIPGW